MQILNPEHVNLCCGYTGDLLSIFTIDFPIDFGKFLLFQILLQKYYRFFCQKSQIALKLQQ